MTTKDFFAEGRRSALGREELTQTQTGGRTLDNGDQILFCPFLQGVFYTGPTLQSMENLG